MQEKKGIKSATERERERGTDREGKATDVWSGGVERMSASLLRRVPG
jgi:hypothetical protein